jgi:hypothetical protein
MHRKPVESSSIRSIGYDPATRTLEIEFHDGTVYQYLNIPPVVHRDLLNAASIGQYFAYFVKTSYPSRRIL